jgi:hypothetical protein
MRVADLTLRESSDERLTIDNLLASGWISSWQRPIYALAAAAIVRLRGQTHPAVRFGAQVPRMASSSRHEVRYGKTERELRGLALGLITAGFTPRTIEVGDAPDALVTFEDGVVWVEFAEVIDAPSARYTNMMNDLSRDVKDCIDADPVASDAVRGHHLEFRLAACPSKSEVRTVREELLAFIRSRRHVSIQSRTLTQLSSPILQRIGATLYRADWCHTEDGSPHILNIQAAAHSFSPLSLAPIAYRRLERKRRLGFQYGVQPLWLVLGVTDIRGVWEMSIDLLSKSCPAIDPYSRVILYDGPRAIIWTNGLVVARDLRSLATTPSNLQIVG